MHFWGDEWFKAHGDNLRDAIVFITNSMRNERIGFICKEKYGTLVTEHISFWDGGLYHFLHPGRTGVYSTFCAKCGFINNIATVLLMIIDKLDNLFLKKLHNNIGVTHKVRLKQFNAFNRIYQDACRQYSDVTDELVVDCDMYRLITPGKLGDVDGLAIHEKYWKAMSNSADIRRVSPERESVKKNNRLKRNTKAKANNDVSVAVNTTEKKTKKKKTKKIVKKENK